MQVFLTGSDADQNMANIAQCAGKHVFINVPCNILVETLRHYVQHKRQDPVGTSACIVVPEILLRRRDVPPLLTGMQVIRSYNQDAFSPSSEFDAYRPYPVVVYYDPVGLQLNAIEGTGLTFMFEGIALRGQAGHVPANICFDSGANSVFVSQAFVERSGFSTKP